MYRTDLSIGEMVYDFVSSLNIPSSWLFSLNKQQFIFYSVTVKAPYLINNLFRTLEFVLKFMVSCVQGTSFRVLVDLHGKASAGTTVQAFGA